MTWRVSNSVSRFGKCKNSRHENIFRKENIYWYLDNQFNVYIAPGFYSKFVALSRMTEITENFSLVVFLTISFERWQHREHWVSSQSKKEEPPTKHPTNGQSGNTSPPTLSEDCIKQVSEQIEGRVLKHCSGNQQDRFPQEDQFFVNPEVQTKSGTAPSSIPENQMKSQETNGDRCQKDLHPEVRSSVYQSNHSIDAEPNEARCIVKGVQEELPHCFPVFSSEKQKKARSTSQP